LLRARSASVRVEGPLLRARSASVRVKGPLLRARSPLVWAKLPPARVRSPSVRGKCEERTKVSKSKGTIDNMFSREQVLALMRDRVHHPAGMRELLQLLKVPRDERTTFKRHVKSLVASGDLIQIRGHRFGLPEKMDLYVGRLQTHPAGYGFVTPERQIG